MLQQQGLRIEDVLHIPVFGFRCINLVIRKKVWQESVLILKYYIKIKPYFRFLQELKNEKYFQKFL